MRSAPITAILVEDRQRKQFHPKKLIELRDSIGSKGLMHPIVCAKEDGKLRLIAGERRLRAITELHKADRIVMHDGGLVERGEIPYTLVDELSEDMRMEMELEENIMREDLTWQERTEAYAKLHALRQKENPKQTVLDTAREFEGSEISVNTARRNIADATVIVQHLEDPDVQRAKNSREAMKIISRKTENLFRAELAKRTAKRATQHTLIHGDLYTELHLLEQDTFRTIIFDPPYGIGADQFGDAANRTHKYEDTAEAAQAMCEFVARHGFEITKPDAHIFIFCDFEAFPVFRGLTAMAGWKVRRVPLIWSKGNMGHLPDQERSFRRTYECILYASKGDPRLLEVCNDVIAANPPQQRRHAAEKPGVLYERLLKLSTFPGDQVLDPCCGSGTIFEGAYGAKVTATGIEMEAEAHTTALARLGELAELANERAAQIRVEYENEED